MIHSALYAAENNENAEMSEGTLRDHEIGEAGDIVVVKPADEKNEAQTDASLSDAESAKASHIDRSDMKPSTLSTALSDSSKYIGIE